MQYIPCNMGGQQGTQGKYISNNSTGGMPNLWKQERNAQTISCPLIINKMGITSQLSCNFSLSYVYLPVRQGRQIWPRTSHFLSLWILDLLGFQISFKHECDNSETGSGPILKWKNCKSPTELHHTEKTSSYVGQPNTWIHCFQKSKTFFHFLIWDGGQSPLIR